MAARVLGEVGGGAAGLGGVMLAVKMPVRAEALARVRATGRLRTEYHNSAT